MKEEPVTALVASPVGNLVEPLGIWPKVMIGMIFLAIQGFFAFWGPTNILDGQVAGPDSYMRLNRVVQLHETGDWQDSRYRRSNAPYGENLHWTRPVDGYLLAGGWIGERLGSFEKGLLISGILMSPIFHGVALIGIAWIGRKVFSAYEVVFLSCVFMLQPGVTAFFTAGTVDHHGLLLMLCIWSLGCLLALVMWPFSIWLSLCTGLVLAVNLWISLEALLLLLVYVLIGASCWIYQKNSHDLPKKFLVVFAIEFVALCGALLLERPWSQVLMTEYDKISWVHALLIGLIASFWALATKTKMSEVLNSPGARFAGFLGWGVLSALLVALLAPKFFLGPMGDIDPEVMKLAWDRILQVQPLLGQGEVKFGPAIFWLGIALPTIPYLYWLIKHEEIPIRCLLWWCSLVGMSMFIPLTFYQIRWAGYAEIFLLFPYVDLLWRFAHAYHLKPETGLADFSKGSLLAAGALGSFLLGLVVIQSEAKANTETLRYALQCPVHELSVFLQNAPVLRQDSKTIATYFMAGPEILYRTSHKVLGTPYHRNRDGIVDGHTVFASSDIAKVREIVDRRKIDLFIICSNSKEEREFYRNGDSRVSLYQLLNAKSPPPWVRQLTLPDRLSSKFVIYQVKKPIEFASGTETPL